VAGDLSGPTTLAPEAAARALLRSAPDLAPVDLDLLGAATVRHLQRGAVVRFALQHAGIPVADATAVVRLDERGRARMVLGSPVRVDPAASAIPSLDATAARRLLAATYAAHRASLVEHAVVRLVWAPRPDHRLRLAWEIRLAPVPMLAESLLYRIDAQTGALLTARNLVRFADQGKVYQWNPVKSTLQTVTLPGRAPNAGQPADALSNPYVNVLNCIDEHQLTPVSLMGYNLNVHMCTEKSTVVRDGNGDYLLDPPVSDVWGADPATHPADEDAFSEVQMYYHVMQAYTYFQAFANPAFTELDDKPIQATVNFRIPIDYTAGTPDLATLLTTVQDPNGTLYAMPNAAYMPAGPFMGIPGMDRPASIVFGQAESADFAYDGDVVFHEFTHGVIFSTANFSGGVDEQGLDPAPTALHEGFADIFSSFISGDGETGEYAGASLGLGPIRDLNVKYTCPDLLWGESHQDSMAFSWAVWGARVALGADADAPVFAALVSLVTDSGFAEASAAVESEINDALGSSAAATAHAKLLEANVIDCRRVIDYVGPRQVLYTVGTSSGISPMPGYLQFKYTLPARAQSLHVGFRYSAGMESLLGGGGTPAYSAYVRKDAPITWTYGVTGRTATGTKDYELELTSADSNATFAGDLAQLLEPGDYYIMIVSTGAASGTLQQVAITHVGAPQDDAGPPQDDAGTGDDAGDGGGGRKGCDCRAASSSANGGLAALLVLALLFIRRRR
jgi:MYXO-CTERM domain-containing protein